MLKKILLLLILVFPVFGFSIQDWEIKKTRQFKASNLYGHINGGAELFLELGFKQLTVDYYSNGKNEIVIETYEMDSPESALAIYLQKCSSEKPVKNVKTRNTGDRFQISCVKSNYYIIINNQSGKEELFNQMITLCNNSLGQIKGAEKVQLLSVLPKKNMISGSITIFRGMYSLQSIYTFGEGDVLLQKGKLFGISADYNSGEGKYTLLKIRYPSTSEALKAFNNLILKLDNTKKIISRNKNNLIFKDHSGKFGKVELNDKNIDLKINLLKAE